MPRKKKHPMEMTDEEALKHIFHPKIVKAIQRHLKKQGGSSKTRSRKKA